MEQRTALKWQIESLQGGFQFLVVHNNSPNKE